MIQPLYLSRARLRSQRGEALSAIAPLLIPNESKHRAGHAHRVLWLLFQDIPDAARDFLWRDEGGGKYMILSHRPPTDPLGLFDVDTKPFEPQLAVGDRLRFQLRANPTMARKPPQAADAPAARLRGTRVDIVMDALRHVAAKERAAARDQIARQAGISWLDAQGAKSCFRLLQEPHAPLVDGYAQVAVERGRKGRPAGFSVLNLSGEIEISNPQAFLARLPTGFGSAKAFGNGLMLIRRA